MVLIEHRVTDEKEKLIEVVTWMRSVCVVHLACFELSKSGTPHMHAVLDTNKTASTYRQKFVEKFPNYKGNQSYKISPVDKYDDKIKYLCKGNELFKPDILFNGKEIDIEENYKQFWSKNKELREKSGISFPQVKKKVRPNFMQESKDEFIKKYPDFTPNYCKKDLEILTCFMCKRLGNSVKILDEIILKRMVLGLLNSLNPDSKLTPSLFAKMFPDFADDKFCFID